MTWRWASAAALLWLAVPLDAQQVRELGVQGTVLASNPAVLVGGAYGAIRTTARTRVALTAQAGEVGGAVAWRGELVAHFLLSPARRRGPGLYGGGGVAVQGSQGNEQGFVVLLVGLESAPAGRSGWMLEAGLGGGFRAAAGWRWRWRVRQ